MIMNDSEQRNGIGIWWKKEEGVTSSLQIHLDINVWNTIKKQDTDYIEFGIKIKNHNDLKELNIYLPYLFHAEDIEDKSNDFGNKSFVSALYNEKVTIESGTGSQTIVTRADKSKFCVYAPKRSVEGQILTLKPRAINNVEAVYYRIRINKLENIFTSVNDNNYFLEGLFKEIGFVEFNINEHRRLPEKIADELSSEEFTFESIHFFYMTDTNTNIIYQSLPNDSSRILEKHIWSNYLAMQNSTDVENKKIIALHWKLKQNGTQKILDFSLFLKLSSTLKSNIALYSAIITLVIIGAVGGLFGNYLTDFVKFYFFAEEELNWVRWKTFLSGILILVVLPFALYLLKKLYNITKRAKVRLMMSKLYLCLRGGHKK